MAAGTRQALGGERIAWLGAWPRVQAHGPMALVPQSLLSAAGRFAAFHPALEYDVASEVRALHACRYPRAAWIAKTLDKRESTNAVASRIVSRFAPCDMIERLKDNYESSN